jgi:hypothetical protein
MQKRRPAFFLHRRAGMKSNGTSEDTKTTRRDSNREVIQEGGLPKDRKSAEGGDNRRLGDQDGNHHAATPKRAPR